MTARAKTRLAKLKAEKRKLERDAKSRQRRMDRLALKVVSAVVRHMTGSKLYAYGGIEATRDVREILMRAVLRELRDR